MTNTEQVGNKYYKQYFVTKRSELSENKLFN